MKYLSIVIFASLMYWTWTITNSEATVSFETHAGIQDKVASLIVETIKSKKPEAQDIQIDKIWTELMNGDSVKAHFSYRFKLPSAEGISATESVMSGVGLLNRQADDGSGLEKWSLSEVKTTNNLIIFEEAQVITTGEDTTK